MQLGDGLVDFALLQEQTRAIHGASSVESVELHDDAEALQVTLNDGVTDGSFIADVLVKNGFRLNEINREARQVAKDFKRADKQGRRGQALGPDIADRARIWLDRILASVEAQAVQAVEAWQSHAALERAVSELSELEPVSAAEVRPLRTVKGPNPAGG